MNFKNINKALNDFGKYVVQQSRSRLTKGNQGGGALYDSIRYTLDEEQKGFILDFYMEDYGKETLKNGWLHTGDKGRIDKDGFLFITGRIKDMFKTSKGKYIEPGVIEADFGNISEFSQLCIVGLNCTQPILLAVPSESAIKNKEDVTKKLTKVLEDVNSKLDNYKKVSKIILVREDWLPENGMTTPTLKIKRAKIDEKFSNSYVDWEKNGKTVIWE